MGFYIINVTLLTSSRFLSVLLEEMRQDTELVRYPYKVVCLDFVSFISSPLTWFTSPRCKSNLFQLNDTNLKSLERPCRTYHSLSRKISLPHNYRSWAYPSFSAQLRCCCFYTLSDTTPSNPGRINPSNLYSLLLFCVVFRNVLTMVFTPQLIYKLLEIAYFNQSHFDFPPDLCCRGTICRIQ